MFNWFKNIGRPKYPTWADIPPTDMEKVGADMSKIIPFPEPKAIPPMPQVQQEPMGKTVYSVGLTDNNLVSLHVGYSSIIMNEVGVQQLIDQLALFKSQIEQAEE